MPSLFTLRGCHSNTEILTAVDVGDKVPQDSKTTWEAEEGSAWK